MTGCPTCGGDGMKHDLGAHFDAGEDVRVTYAEGGYIEGGYIEPDAGPKLEHPAPYVLPRPATIRALRELHNVACDNERDHPAYAYATWDAIERIQKAAGIDELWPEGDGDAPAR